MDIQFLRQVWQEVKMSQYLTLPFNIQQTDDIFIFSQKIGFDVSCKLSPWETICIKRQILFSEKK